MNVRLPSDSRPTAPVSKTEAVRSDSSAAGGARADQSASADASQGARADRVEISADAQAKSVSPPPSGNLEIEVARVALGAGDKLSLARLHELRERVRTGFYDNPPTIDRIAEAAARDLVGGRS